MKKTLSIILAIALLLSQLSLTAFTAEAATVTSKAQSGSAGAVAKVLGANKTELYYKSVQDAVDDVEAGFGINTIVTLLADVRVTATVKVKGKVNINLNGYSISRSGSADFSVLTVSSGELTVSDSVGSGSISNGTGNNSSGTRGGGVYVASGAKFILKGGKIYNCSAKWGGGVHVYGEFTMNGGIISANSASAEEGGGGVFVDLGGSFTMNGGIIRSNTAYSGAGVAVQLESSSRKGVFTMNGGTIENNTSAYGGGGVLVREKGAFTMNGGTIRGNAASTLSGGGVYLKNGAVFTMNGGSIKSNTAYQSGGGVYVDAGGRLLLNGGSIESNTSKDGGGVYLSGGSFDMTGGELTGNTSDKGGAVSVAKEAAVNMTGGTIGGTTEEAANTASYGGGVYVMAGGTFNMGHVHNAYCYSGEGEEKTLTCTLEEDAASICGNTATMWGGGVYIIGDESFRGQFTLVNGTVCGNEAKLGGGFYLDGGAMYSHGGSIESNTADLGGGVYNMGTVLIEGSITKNTAGTEGGGLFNHMEGEATVSGVITENLAKVSGGGVCNNGSLILTGSPDITGNYLSDTSADQSQFYGKDLYTTAILTIGDLKQDAKIGIRVNIGGSYEAVFTKGPVTGLANCFTTEYNEADPIEKKLVVINKKNSADPAQVCLATVPVSPEALVVNQESGGRYIDLQLAIDSAAIGDTLQLQNDFTLTDDLTISKNLTLDLHNYMLKINAEDKSIKVTAGARLTLKDTARTGAAPRSFEYSTDYWKESTAVYTVLLEDLNSVPESNTIVGISGGIITGGVFTGNGGVIRMTDSGEVVMEGGTIVGNRNGSESGNGAAVYIENGSFCLNGGSIVGNSGFRGPGVYVCSEKTFSMNGGSIRFNSASGNGGGVYNNDGTVTLKGASVIRDNHKVVSAVPADDNLYTMKEISVELLTDGAEIHITKGYEDGIGAFTAPVSGYSEYFVSDEGYYVIHGSDSRLSLVSEVPDPVVENVTRGGMSESIAQAIANATEGDTLKLLKNIDLTGQLEFTKNLTLDLNGYQLARKGGSCYRPVYIRSGVLTLTDSYTGTDRVHYFTVGSDGLWTATDEAGENTQTVIGGVITGGDQSGDSADNGGAVYVDSNAGAGFVLAGGTIAGNKADFGGGVYVQTDASFTMTGGTVIGNLATDQGGGIFVVGTGTCIMNSGLITGNRAEEYGGGLNLSTGGSFTMAGGIISGNSAGKNGGGVYSRGSVTVEGTPKIENNTKGAASAASNLMLKVGGPVSGSMLTVNAPDASGAHIGVSVSTDGDDDSEAAAFSLMDSAYPGCFFPDLGDGYVIVNDDDGRLMIAPSSAKVQAVNPETGAQYTSLQAALNLVASGKTIDLCDNIVLTESIVFNRADIDATLNLNGYQIKGSGSDVVLNISNGHLTVTDENRNDGTYYTGAHYFTSSDGFYQAAESSGAETVSVTGGVITGGVRTSEGNTDGGGVYISGAAGFTFAGGTIVGNEAGYGGGIYFNNSGIAEITGGTVCHNRATDMGGGVEVYSGTFNLKGGVISGNTAANQGGGIYAASGATVNATGGDIAGNSAATSGGGVYNASEGFTLSGDVKILTNTCGSDNNNLYTTAEILVKDMTMGATPAIGIAVSSGTCFSKACDEGFATCFISDVNENYTVVNDSANSNKLVVVVPSAGVLPYEAENHRNGGRYTLLQSALSVAADGDTVTMASTIDRRGKAAATIEIPANKIVTLDLSGKELIGAGDDQCIIKICSGAKFTLTDSSDEQTGRIRVISYSVTPGDGGAVYSLSGSTFIMNGGTISGTKATYGGGAYITGDFIMNSGRIIGCNAGLGGAVFVNSETGGFTMNGGTIGGTESGEANTAAGTGSGMGGGVYVWNGTFTMNEGTIAGNEAIYGGGVYIANRFLQADFVMNSGVIRENEAEMAGGVYIAKDCTFTMNGGSVSGNTAVQGTSADAGNGAGVYAVSGAVCTLTGGEITGNTGTALQENETVTHGDGMYNNGTLTVSGTAKIYGNLVSIGDAAAQAGKDLYTAQKITAGEFTEGANVCVSMTIGGNTKGRLSANDTTGSAKYIHSNAGYDTVNDNGYVEFIDGTNTVVAEITDNGGLFTSLQAAIDRTEAGQTVKLYDEPGSEASAELTHEVSIVIAAGRELILDLDGKTLKKAGTGQGSVITVSGDLTLKNGTVSGGDAGCGGGLYVSEGGGLEVVDCVITGNKAALGGGGLAVISSGKAVLKNTTVCGNYAENGAGHEILAEGYDFGELGEVGVALTEGSEVGAGYETEGGYAVYVTRAVFTMNGSVIEGIENRDAAVLIRAGRFQLSSSSVINNECMGVQLQDILEDGEKQQSVIVISGNAAIKGNRMNLWLESDEAVVVGNYTETGKPEIWVGFESGNGVVTKKSNADHSSLFVSDQGLAVYNKGSLDSQQVEVSGVNSARIIAADRSFTYYASLQQAIRLLKDGESVQLIRDVMENVTIYEETEVTLDLNGKKLRASTAAGTAITNYGDLTLIDSAGGGNVTGSKIGLKQYGTLTVDGRVSITGSSEKNLYLPADKIVTVEGDDPLYMMNRDVRIGVSLQDALTDTKTVSAITGENSRNISAYFVSDLGYGVAGDTQNRVLLCTEIYTIVVSSAVKDKAYMIAQVSGGGVYPIGAEVTLTAPAAVGGYVFDHWELDGAAVSGTPATEYSFTPSSDGEYTAIYKVSGTAADVILTAEAGSYTVTVGEEEMVSALSGLSEAYAIGTRVLVRYQGDDFEAWVDEYGNVLSKNRNYSFMLIRAKTVKVRIKAN